MWCEGGHSPLTVTRGPRLRQSPTSGGDTSGAHNPSLAGTEEENTEVIHTHFSVLGSKVLYITLGHSRLARLVTLPHQPAKELGDYALPVL